MAQQKSARGRGRPYKPEARHKPEWYIQVISSSQVERPAPSKGDFDCYYAGDIAFRSDPTWTEERDSATNMKTRRQAFKVAGLLMREQQVWGVRVERVNRYLVQIDLSKTVAFPRVNKIGRAF